MSIISVPLVVLILLVVGITIVVVKAGSIALRLTGLDAERAGFQALSAVTGTGFTTREAELVMADSRRRKIVSALMIFGNVVLVTVISLLVGSFTTLQRNYELALLVVVLAVGAYALYRIFMARRLAPKLNEWIEGKVRTKLRLRERPIHEVLALAEGYGVAEVGVQGGSPCAGKTLGEARLREAGLLVLAIRRGGRVLPTPRAADRIETGDRLVCYGELERMHAFVRAAAPPADEQAPPAEPPPEPAPSEPPPEPPPPPSGLDQFLSPGAERGKPGGEEGDEGRPGGP